MKIKIVATLLMLLLFIVACASSTESSSNDELDAARDNVAESERSSSTDKDDYPPEEKPTVGYNEAVLEKELTFDTFPVELPVKLHSGQKYNVYFEADQPIQFVLYDELRLNEWKEYGAHTLSKVTTKSGQNCCSTTSEWTIDINKQEGGTYYAVFDDAKLPEADPRPTSGKVRIVLSSGI